MSSSGEFDNSWLPNSGSTYAELAPRAAAIESMARTLLETPDWTQTQLHYETPFGPDYTLDLSARDQSRSNPRPTRNLQVRVNNAEGINLCRLMMNLDEPAKHQGKYPQAEDAAKLLEEVKDADPAALELVRNALQLHLHGYDQAIVDKVNTRYAALLMEGSTNNRIGIWHTLEDGTFVGLAHTTKEGEQPWPEIDNEYELAVRVKPYGRVVDFQKRRDGMYETFETDHDTGKLLRSIVGESRVLGEGENAVEVDLGDNKSKHAVIEEAERAMGLRALDTERLDRIEEGLQAAVAER